MSGPIPESLLTLCVVVTVFTVMFALGLGIVPGQLLRWTVQRPGLMARALFSVLVAVPAIALLVTRAIDLPRAAQIGIVLMSISPGAPVALRRSLGAGGHQAFAPSLQICVVTLLVASMPLSIALLNHVYAGQASIAPSQVARQVFIAQLLPLGLGMALRHLRAGLAQRLEPMLGRIGTFMLFAVVILILIDVWEVTIDAGLRGAAAVVLTTAGALAVGHLLGGPEPAHPHRGGDHQRRAQPGPGAAGGYTQPRPAGDPGDGAGLPHHLRVLHRPVRRVASPYEPSSRARGLNPVPLGPRRSGEEAMRARRLILVHFRKTNVQ